MKLTHTRIAYGKNSILSILQHPDDADFYLLENKHTAIPCGNYELQLYDDGNMDDEYAARFTETEHPMLKICGVLGRSAILIHIGNFYFDSEGCPLIGEEHKYEDGDYHLLPSSTNAYKRFYYPIRKAIENGKKVEYVVRDVYVRGVLRDDDDTFKVGNGEVMEDMEKGLSKEVGRVYVPELELTVPFYCNPAILRTSKNILMASINFAFDRVTGIRIFEPEEEAKEVGILQLIKEILKIIVSSFKRKDSKNG